MRFTATLVLVCGLCVTAVSGTDQPPAKGEKLPDTLQVEPYSNGEYGFSIHFPKDYKNYSKLGKGTIVACQHESGLANLNIRSGPSGKDTVATVFAASKKGLSAALTDVKFHGEGDVTVDAAPAKWMDLSHRAGETSVRALGYVFVKGGKYFMIVCTARDDVFDQHKQALRDSAESLKIK